ncbi:MAG: translation initiation factor IF-2 [Deltaproteobacteria bacterium]|nr:MAG: translation initiation factor IF-2 [Deltaproteobacteria bacterium]
MSKRLIEVARDLEMSSRDLLDKVRELSLPFKVADTTTLLSPEQVDILRKALVEQAERPPERKRVSAGVIRRRVRADRRDAAEAEEAAEAAEATQMPSEVPQTLPQPVDSPDSVEDAPPARQQRFSTVVSSTRAQSVDEPEAASPEGAEPEAVPADEPVEVDAPRRARFSTVVTRAVEDAANGEVPEAHAVAEEGVTVEDAVDAPRQRFSTVVTRPEGERSGGAGPENLSPMERAAMARLEVDAQADGRGAARVVGTLNPDLLNTRLEVDRKDFSPGKRRPDEDDRRKGRKGKKVVQSRDLYDRNARRGKKGKGVKGSGQTTRITQAAEHKRVVRMEDSILIGDLAHQMGVKAGEIVMKLAFELGMKGANINTAIDFDTAQLLAELYEFKVEQVGFDLTKYLPKYEEAEDSEEQRAPVVTVMGHVDHGKTSLLDAIRSSSVTTGEAGGITQHIGAYKVVHEEREVCFLDTPGHEAFTALRARGAQATDIVILVVAADDGVMPQTVEAINHARDAEVPIIVAINKIDKPGANPERIRQALTEYGLVAEDWGGDTIFVEVSALKGEGIGSLLDMVFLQAEVLELTANPNRPGEGVVIESKLDVGRGPVATVIVQRGTLTPGQIVVIGQHYGRVRTMSDEHGRLLETAGPSTPVELTGLSGVPESGETLYVVNEEKDARTIAEHVGAQAKQADMALSVTGGATGMERIAELMRAGELKELKLVVKGDVQGSVEALNQALVKLSTEKVVVRVIHSGVGSITESDVNLASTSDDGVGVVVVGFNVKPEARAQQLADQNGVSILTHSIIYEILDQVTTMMVGLLEPVYVEEYIGRAEVRKVFSIPKVGKIAGCMVLDGVMQRNARAKVVRNGEIIQTGTISSLRHFDKDEKEIRSGFECGISLERFNALEEGDLIEAFRVKETQATL